MNAKPSRLSYKYRKDGSVSLFARGRKVYEMPSYSDAIVFASGWYDCTKEEAKTKLKYKRD